MSRVGILTFHNNDNRGAILQAYALSEFMNEEFNLEAEVIEYRTEAFEKSRWRRKFITKRPKNIIKRIHDDAIVEYFIRNEMSTSDASIVTDNYSDAVKWLEKQNYAGIITGSDEVWKIRNMGIRGLVVPPRPFPNLYYLGKSLSAEKFSYGASANRVDVDSLSADSMDMIRGKLQSFDLISVRDNHTVDFVDKILGESPKLVPDPTLLVELPKKDVNHILSRNGIDLSQPILGIHAYDHPIFEKICNHYRTKGYQIIAMTESEYADVELLGIADPLQYYSMYKHFDMVVTNSLHSTIFSIKHGIPFATIDVDRKYQKLESKTFSLLRDFDMLDRHIDAVVKGGGEFFQKIENLEDKFNQRTVNKRIELTAKSGYDFLDQAIGKL